MDREASGGRGLVVAGASLAGLRAVQAARRYGYDGPVVLLGAEEHLPYDRPPLSKEFLTADGEPAYYLTERELREDLAVDLRLGQSATGLDTAARTVISGDVGIPYRHLIIATGARPRLLRQAPGLPGVRTLRTLDDAREIRQAIRPGSHVVIVGTALAQSVRFASGGPDDERFVAFYRVGERLVGAATLNEPRKVMKLRRLIAGRGSWEGALELLAELSRTRVGAGQDGAAATMKMARL